MKKYLLLIIVFCLALQSIVGQDPAFTGDYQYAVQSPSGIMATQVLPISEWGLPRNGEINAEHGTQLLYKGAAKNHRLHGNWQSFYDNSQSLDSGYLVNGIPDGVWKKWNTQGQLIAVRHYDAKKLQQVKEEMRLQHPRRSFYHLSQLYRKNKRQALFYVRYYSSFSVAHSRENNDLQTIVLENRQENKLYQPVFNECLHHGLFMNFFDNGMVKDSGYYKDGLQDGVWIHRNFPDGAYWMGNYQHGLRQQEWKQFDAVGRLTQLIFYNKEGEEQGRKKIER